MKEKEFNQYVNECKENSCYNCACNGTEKCYARDFGIKGFPNRYFSQLTEKEKEIVKKFNYVNK